ncbi:iron-siderophore ABC transporter substrate-binding protein [Janibacter sp. GXQ6167]|uniref:iron-siderophore ABC transporter substrate-binding protein n=1 Tax=Janibacter sp. GXQ6167 TaxID=3240791 RepID=UPI003526025B
MSSPLRRRRVVAASVALIATAFLASCSTGPGATATDAPAGSGVAADEGAFPVTVQHAFGEARIDVEPKRVVTVGWTDHETVAALGVTPVAATKITWGGNADGSTDWFDAKVKELGGAEVVRLDETDGIAVDEIAQLNPDLILGTNSGMTKAEYDKLSKIAPTVAYPKAPWTTPWRESLSTVGQALGRTSAATEVLAQTEKVITEAAARNPEIKGKSVAWGWVTPTDLSSIGFYASEDLRPQMLREFGMTDAGIVRTNSDGKQFSFTVSAEKAATIDADVLIFYADDKVRAKTLTEDRLLSKIPALTKGQYVASADNAIAVTMSSPTPLSIPVAARDFLPKVAQAAQGTPAR